MLFNLFYRAMCFRENLKAELTCSGMLVKELADRAGLKKHTIDQYLSVRGGLPGNRPVFGEGPAKTQRLEKA